MCQMVLGGVLIAFQEHIGIFISVIKESGPVSGGGVKMTNCKGTKKKKKKKKKDKILSRGMSSHGMLDSFSLPFFILFIIPGLKYLVIKNKVTSLINRLCQFFSHI